MSTNLSDNTESSAFLSDSFEDVTQQFTDVQEIARRRYTRLLRAKRYGRWYVLKTLNDDTAGQTVYMQMQHKELELLMRMQHVNIVQGVGFEEVQGVGPSIIMEFVDGENLQECLDKGNVLTTAERRRVAAELCDAVAYMHSLGIVHRDLKPENIMLTRNGRHVKLLDFGMADTDAHAVFKQPAGTLRYMSPEQAQSAVADIRNDIYSLGIVLDMLQIGKRYAGVIAKCLKPIDRRYRSVDDLKADMQKVDSRTSRLRWVALAAVMATLLTVIGIQTLRLSSSQHSMSVLKDDIEATRQQMQQQKKAFDDFHSSIDSSTAAAQQKLKANISTLSDSILLLADANKRLHEELGKTESMKQQALQALHKEQARTRIASHLDTLSHWSYRWTDLSERVMAVSRFVYDYVDKLPAAIGQQERDIIRRAMLDDWQRWSSSIRTKANSIRSKLPEGQEYDLNAKNKPPSQPL